MPATREPQLGDINSLNNNLSWDSGMSAFPLEWEIANDLVLVLSSSDQNGFRNSSSKDQIGSHDDLSLSRFGHRFNQ